ncbi:MAG TPA: cell division protein ZapE [Candidatus Kapabacteria bacterium]|nr:cell division protein ZapE [Candidatus Kapabacteria bacterium]
MWRAGESGVVAGNILIAPNISTTTETNPLLALASGRLDATEMLEALVPPKHFTNAEFSNYIPEPHHPSQAAALKAVSKFIFDLQKKHSAQSFFQKIFGSDEHGHGIYLDGGFGVGKTHLLASAYHSFGGAKAYLSFQELMFLVGLIKLSGVVESFRNYKLLIIDEFELDDPANTRISTNLLGQLFDAGVSILTSSNTPPGALGEGKFSVEDFRRELGSLTKRFKTVPIDGEDYRTIHHLDEGAASTWVATDEELDLVIAEKITSSMNVVDMTFAEFLDALSKVHPMRIRNALGNIDALVLRGVESISHPHEALRFVYAVDKAYDNNILFLASSSVSQDELFQKSYFTGGDTKKFLRTKSRLREMTR